MDNIMVDAIKERYPEGRKVELVQMNDPYVQMPAGLKGTVMFVDDIGTVHLIGRMVQTLVLAYLMVI